MNYYKILMNLHRKTTTTYIGVLIYLLHFHLPQSVHKSIGWERVDSTNHTDTSEIRL